MLASTFPFSILITLLFLTLNTYCTPVPSEPLTKHPEPTDPTAILIDTPNAVAYYAPMRQDNLWHYFNETPCFPHRLDPVFGPQGSTGELPITCDRVAPDVLTLNSANGGHCVWKRKEDEVNVYVIPGVSWKVDIPDRSAWTDVCCGPICY